MITAEKVETIFMRCLWSEDEIAGLSTEEITAKSLLVHGIVTKVGFHPARLEASRKEVQELLSELSLEFLVGYSFLSLPFDRHGNQWGEQRNAEQLMLLGLGLEEFELLIPREFWHMLPGGVPYLVLRTKTPGRPDMPEERAGC